MSEGFGLAALGALYASVVIVVVLALLDTDVGRNLGNGIEGPIRAFVAGPVLALAAVVFVASLAALVYPAARKRLLGIAGIAAWLIPAWLVIGAVLVGSLSYALDRVQ
jgi:hypothetical protein